MDRRTFLASAVGASVIPVAGCQDRAGTPATSETTAGKSDEGSVGWKDDVKFEDVDREVYVEARRYEFTPGSDEAIRVDEGEIVGLAVTSLDNGYHGGHGLAISEYGIDLRAQEYEVDSTTFVADTPGEFEIFCSVYCSEGHHRMTGDLEVTSAN